MLLSMFGIPSVCICAFSVAGSLLRPNWLLGSNVAVAGVNASYDYVIVGGGTSGITLATRLALNGTHSVAGVEAGGFYVFENGNITQIPAFAARSSATEGTLNGINPLIDWHFVTNPQAGAKGRQSHHARGKCLGGSSARNYMQYNRATPGAMRKWADQVGDASHTWEKVLPFYERSVHFTPPNNKTVPANASIGYDVSAFSATGDPLQVSYANYIYFIRSRARKAFLELGLAVNSLGFASGLLMGHQYTAQTYDPRDETRSDSSTSFLTLALQQSSLIVYTHALATRVLFNSDKRATGVAVQANGVRFHLNATKEVIISAGAFQSPQLLMLSGIGPTSTLSQHDIPVIAERPGVDQNLCDHIVYGPSYEVDLETSAIISNPESAGHK